MKKLCICIIAVTLCSQLFAMGEKPLIENKFQLADVVKMMTDLQVKMTALEMNIKSLTARLDGQASVVAGLNNTVSKISTDVHAGRDANSGNSNATEIFIEQLKSQKEIALAQAKLNEYQMQTFKDENSKLYKIIATLIGGLLWLLRKQANEASNARYYQVAIAERSVNGDFRKIMDEKRKHDKERTFLARAVKLFRKESV